MLTCRLWTLEAALLGSVIRSPSDFMDDLASRNELTQETLPLILKLIHPSKIIHVDEKAADIRVLDDTILKALGQAHPLWETSHPAEVGFMKQLWQKTMKQTMSTFLVEQGFLR